jgi:hypothetical protein
MTTADPSFCDECGWPVQQCACMDVEELDDDDYEPDEWEEEMADCHGYFESQSPNAVFVCGAVGSEDCDECPCYAWLGLTNKQIDKLELEDE